MSSYQYRDPHVKDKTVFILRRGPSGRLSGLQAQWTCKHTGRIQGTQLRHWPKRWRALSRRPELLLIICRPINFLAISSPWLGQQFFTYQIHDCLSHPLLWVRVWQPCEHFYWRYYVQNHWWISLTKASDAEFSCFIRNAPEQTIQ